MLFACISLSEDEEELMTTPVPNARSFWNQQFNMYDSRSFIRSVVRWIVGSLDRS